MKAKRIDERLSRADVCLGTDWFANASQPHPAWARLVGFGTHLMAGMLKLKPLPTTQQHTYSRSWHRRRHRIDINP